MTKVKVAFQGESGAYSESAVLEHFGNKADPAPCESFDKVFQAVTEGACKWGIIAIENSLAGSIHRNYDLLLQNDLKVVGEHHVRVHHCLIGFPGTTIRSLRKVISHPQALAQCDSYLRALPGVKVEPVYDTAGSVKMIKEQGDPSIAAIASRRAADIYEMEILQEGIEDNQVNITRFLVIGKKSAPPGRDAKTSIVFALENQPGALFKALSVFALRNIDLTKIESRPLVGKLWEYLFYVDFLGSIQDEATNRALSHLKEYATMLRVLGSYPRHRM